MRAWSLTVLLLLGGLAGCLGADEDLNGASTDDPVNDPATEQTTEAVTDRTSLQVTSSSDDADETRVALLPPGADLGPVTEVLTGTFQAQDACQPAGCLADDVTGEATYESVHDLTHLLPLGVRMDLHIELAHDHQDGTPLYMARPWMHLREELGPLATEERSALIEVAEEELETTLVRNHDGAVQLVVTYRITEPDQTEVNYEATVTATPSNHSLGRGALYALPAGVDDLAITPGSPGAAILVSLWDADAQRIGLYEGEASKVGGAYPLPAADVQRAAALLIHRARDGASVTTSADTAEAAEAAPALTPLAAEVVLGDARDLPEDGVASWTFDVDGVPLQAAIHHVTGLTSWTTGAPATYAEGETAEVRLASPLETVVEGTEESAWNCVVCPDPRSFTWSSHIAHSALVPGTYAADVDIPTDEGGTVQEVLLVVPTSALQDAPGEPL